MDSLYILFKDSNFSNIFLNSNSTHINPYMTFTKNLFIETCNFINITVDWYFISSIVEDIQILLEYDFNLIHCSFNNILISNKFAAFININHDQIN